MLGRASARLRQLFPQQAGSTSPGRGSSLSHFGRPGLPSAPRDRLRTSEHANVDQLYLADHRVPCSSSQTFQVEPRLCLDARVFRAEATARQWLARATHKLGGDVTINGTQSFLMGLLLVRSSIHLRVLCMRTSDGSEPAAVEPSRRDARRLLEGLLCCGDGDKRGSMPGLDLLRNTHAHRCPSARAAALRDGEAACAPAALQRPPSPRRRVCALAAILSGLGQMHVAPCWC